MQVQTQSPVMSYEVWENQVGQSCPPSDGNASMKQVDYVGQNNRFQNNPYSGTYNLGWRKHPNFSSSQPGQRPQGQVRPLQPQPSRREGVEH